MKKIIALIGISLLLAGCQAKPAPEHQSYTAPGRYYTSGEVITQDGNIWGYTQDIISDKPSYDNEPVFAIFDDNGTPDNIYDDEIYGLIFDRETAIYDALETELSKAFSVERNGNVISLSQP